MARSTQNNSWEGVSKLAAAAGAKYPELVAAQWALESGWGKSAPGNNYFGLKGKGQELETTEVINGKEVPLTDSFLKFASLEESVEYLVERWYKDWKEYKGVNRASSRDAAARLLQKEGYATNPRYASRLIEIMNDHAAPPAPVAEPATPSAGKPVVRLRARVATVLKKAPMQSSELADDELAAVEPGRVLTVEMFGEQPGDAHAWVRMSHGAGEWFIWTPHWEVVPSKVVPVVPTGPIDWSNFHALVTKNLTVGEVLQWDHRRRPKAGSSVERRILATAREFQKIRDAWGQPLSVTSFFRPEPINSQVGGVPNSRHVSGEAFDIYPSSGGLERFYQWARVRWTGGFGDGRRKGFIHFDTQSGGHFVPGAGVRPIREWDY